MRKYKSRTLAIGVIVVAATLATINSAAATATAFNQKTQFLTETPTSNMPRSCVDRSIYLAAGNYDWVQTAGTGRRDPLTLNAGTYYWQDCLIPHDGYYEQQSYLKASWDPATLDSSFNLVGLGSGNYNWGSDLVPEF